MQSKTLVLKFQSFCKF